MVSLNMVPEEVYARGGGQAGKNYMKQGGLNGSKLNMNFEGHR